MIRSLRFRFFVIMWPLTVAAVSGVAWSFARWADVELEATLMSRSRVPDATLAALSDGLALTPEADFQLALQRLAEDLGLEEHAVVVSDQGEIVASTDDAITLVEPPEQVGGLAGFERTFDANGMRAQEVLTLSGVVIPREAGGAGLGLYLIDKADSGGLVDSATRVRADVRRTLWMAVILSSVAAAIASFLLAHPMVRQIGRLAAGAAAVEAGDLETRVPEGPQDELGRLERSFNSMAESLTAAERLKRNMVSDIAHELRTPLTNLVGLLEAIEDGMKEADAATVGTLRREAGMLASLVDELQELSLAESGQLDFDLSVCDARQEADLVIEAYATGSEGPAVVGPGAGDVIPVYADRRRLRQILSNLLRNAVAYTPAAGVVSLGVEARGDRVLFILRDTGVGIPPEELPLIWERFHRVDRSRDRASGGMGLGLAIVHHLAVGMDGRLGVESAVGEGTTFTLDLPAGFTSP